MQVGTTNIGPRGDPRHGLLTCAGMRAHGDPARDQVAFHDGDLRSGEFKPDVMCRFGTSIALTFHQNPQHSRGSHLTPYWKIMMYIGGGILSTVLVVLLIVYLARRV